MKVNEIIFEEDEKRQLLVEYAGIELYANDHCQPYLNKVGGFKNAVFVNPMYRGMSDLSFDKGTHSKVINVNQNRQPTDTPIGIQTLIDDWFEDEYGVRFRQTSLHCSGNIVTALAYSDNRKDPLIVLPIGNFNYCWSLIVRDMFDDLGAFEYSQPGGDIGSSRERIKTWNKDKVDAFMNRSNYRVNEGLVTAIKSQNEIMVSCREALVIQHSFLRTLVRNENM